MCAEMPRRREEATRPLLRYNGARGGGLTLSCDVYLPAAPPPPCYTLPLYKHEAVSWFSFIKFNFSIGQYEIWENAVKQWLFFAFIAGKHS